MKVLGLIPFAILALLGGDSERPSRVAGADRIRIKVVDSDFGPVIADGKGEALYRFSKESARKSECYGACAQVWPPVVSKGRPVAGARADQSLLGSIKRGNGRRQVTYDGRPLYYYVGDSPGNILCQDVFEFGGNWTVLSASGDPVS